MFTNLSSYNSRGCDDYKISTLGLPDRSDIIMNNDIITQLCIQEKKVQEIEKRENNKFISYCDDIKQIELELVYKNENEENECNWRVLDQKPITGMYGSAYTACCGQGLDQKEECGYILKIDTCGYKCKEVYIHLLLSNLEIAPKLYEVWKVKSITNVAIATIFIMQKLDKNLYDILINRDRLSDDYINRIYRELMEKLDILYNKKIKHNDIHLHNIMTDSNGTIYLIDFGKSEKFGSMLSSDEYLRTQLQELSKQLKGESIKEMDEGVSDNFKRFYNKISLHSEPADTFVKRTIKIGGTSVEPESQQSILRKKYEEDKKRREMEILTHIRELREEEERLQKEEEERSRVIPYNELLGLINEELKSNSFLDIEENVELVSDDFKDKINLLSSEEKLRIEEYLKQLANGKIELEE